MLRDQLECNEKLLKDIRKSLEVYIIKMFEKFLTFWQCICQFNKAGEASESLMSCLKLLFMKKELLKKIKGVSCIQVSCCSSYTVSAFMLIKVVPVFAKMYDGMGIEFPAATNHCNYEWLFEGTGGILLLSLSHSL